jgi:hypothetical protein
MAHLGAASSRNRSPFKSATLLGGLLATASLLGQISTPLCTLLDQPHWFTLEILRILFILFDLQSFVSRILGDSSLLYHLPQLAACLCPLLHALVS